MVTGYPTATSKQTYHSLGRGYSNCGTQVSSQLDNMFKDPSTIIKTSASVVVKYDDILIHHVSWALTPALLRILNMLNLDALLSFLVIGLNLFV